MTTEQVSLLKFEDHIPLLVERLSSSNPTPSQSELRAEFDIYIAELISEVERVEDLKSRFSALSDHGLLQAQGISNPDKHFQDAVLGVEASSAESEMQALEQAYSAKHAELHADSWLKSRQVEYAKLDSMLLEGLAEAAADRPEKLQEYLVLREQIKLQFPKPE